MIQRRRRRRQRGAGIFDIIKKGAKFLGGKKARKILNLQLLFTTTLSNSLSDLISFIMSKRSVITRSSYLLRLD